VKCKKSPSNQTVCSREKLGFVVPVVGGAGMKGTGHQTMKVLWDFAW